jgi:type IV fimbrial biogenesis protein FimT
VQFRLVQAGVTMVELMIVVSIAGIMAALAAPSFNDFIYSMRLTSTMSQITSGLNQARSEAIKRNAQVLFCKRDTTGTGCVNGSQYHVRGWVICYDQDMNDVCDTDLTGANPNPIAIHDAPTSMKLVLSRADASTTPIRFNPNGTQGTAAVTLTLALVNADGITPVTSTSFATSSVVTVAVTGNISKTP